MNQKIHCIQSGCIGPRCMESTAFNHAAFYPLLSIEIHCSMLHGIHCIQSCCMGSTTFNRVPLCQTAWHPLHSIMLHGILCIQFGSIEPFYKESTAFSHAA